MVGAVPMGRSWQDAEEIKVIARLGSARLTQVVASPFQGATVTVYSPPEFQEDGTWRLLRITRVTPKSGSTPSTWGKVTLACRFKHLPADTKPLSNP